MAEEVELEPNHRAALAEIAERLRGNRAVAALVPAQVFGPGADDLARAGEWARCVLVTPGRNHGGGTDPRLLVQRDAWIEMRAESQEVLDLLARAVVKALAGAVGKTFQHCVHTHSNPAADGPGYLSRKDVFGLHVRAPAGRAPGAGAPPKIGTVPAAPPPKLSEEK